MLARESSAPGGPLSYLLPVGSCVRARIPATAAAPVRRVHARGRLDSVQPDAAVCHGRRLLLQRRVQAESTEARIQQLFNHRIRPFVQRDGGDVEVIEWDATTKILKVLFKQRDIS